MGGKEPRDYTMLEAPGRWMPIYPRAQPDTPPHTYLHNKDSLKMLASIQHMFLDCGEKTRVHKSAIRMIDLPAEMNFMVYKD